MFQGGPEALRQLDTGQRLQQCGPTRDRPFVTRALLTLLEVRPLLAVEAVIPVAHHRSRKTGSEIPNIPRVTSLLFRVTCPHSVCRRVRVLRGSASGVPVFSDYDEARDMRPAAFSAGHRQRNGNGCVGLLHYWTVTVPFISFGWMVHW